MGGIPPRGLKFSKPGAMHFARWTAKAIYSIQILMFRDQFPEITESEVNGLIEVVGFITKCYSSFWFNADKPEQAPVNDLEFIRKLERYKTINIKIAEKAISKFINHLYYLNDECVGFALFDDRIDDETKANLSERMCLSHVEEKIMKKAKKFRKSYLSSRKI